MTVSKTVFAMTALLALTSIPVHADLTLSSPPFQNKTEEESMLPVLAQQLAEVLGEPVRYVPATYGMSDYGKHVRNGDYDILLDGPQFGAWRIAKGIHKPVAQSELKLIFVVFVPVSDIKTNSPDQLANKSVCLQPSPSLSNLMFMNMFSNPFQLPDVQVNPDYKKIVENVIKGKCDAGVIPAAMYEKKLDQVDQGKLRIIYSTPPLPGIMLTVSSKVSESKREALKDRITKADPANDKLVQSLNAASGRGAIVNKTKWHAVDPEENKGLDKILVKQAYGWD